MPHLSIHSTSPLPSTNPTADPLAAVRDHPVADQPASLAEALEPLLAQLLRLARRGLAEDCQLLTSRQLADLLAVSAATLERMRAAGRLLEPVELSRGCHRYRLAEVREWIEAGCPDRRTWLVMRATRNGSGRPR